MTKKLMILQKRGALTKRIREQAKKSMGREISQIELRLMPYVLTVMMNEQRIDPIKINQSEREILADWRQAGYIEGGAGGLNITTEFWKIICEIVRLGYVDLDVEVEA